ncbi:MAG: hypothetical protein ACP5Q0_02045 [Halothiobacillus sp.]
MRDAIDVLADISTIGFTFFQARDVVRHPMVMQIVNAYEHRDAQSRGGL